MAIVCVGMGLAKNVFAVRDFSKVGQPDWVRPAVLRDKLHELKANPSLLCA